MKSTGWIAVVAWLLTSLVWSQEAEIRREPTPSESASTVDESPKDSARAGNAFDATPPLPFEVELEQLRNAIAVVKQLREQVAAAADEPVSDDAAASAQQRRQLLELLTKLAAKNLATRAAAAEPPVAEPVSTPPTTSRLAASSKADSSKSPAHPLITDKVVDPFALGRALFRAGDYQGAELAFRKVRVTEDNRVLLQYLVATCLRKQGKWEQATKAYRVVAENNDDPALRDLAQWQLDNIRWHQETETQVEQLRQLRERSGSTAAIPNVSDGSKSR